MAPSSPPTKPQEQGENITDPMGYVTTKTLAAMKSTKPLLETHLKSVKGLLSAYEAMAAAERSYAQSLMAFDTKANVFCTRDAVDGLKVASGIHESMAQAYTDAIRKLNDEREFLKKLAEEEGPALAAFDKEYRKEMDYYASVLKAAEGRTAKIGKKDKDPQRLAMAIQEISESVKKQQQCKRTELQKLLLMDRNRMCSLMRGTWTTTSTLGQALKRTATTISDETTHWLGDAIKPSELPILGQRLCAERQQTYHSIGDSGPKGIPSDECSVVDLVAADMFIGTATVLPPQVGPVSSTRSLQSISTPPPTTGAAIAKTDSSSVPPPPPPPPTTTPTTPTTPTPHEANTSLDDVPPPPSFDEDLPPPPPFNTEPISNPLAISVSNPAVNETADASEREENNSEETNSTGDNNLIIKAKTGEESKTGGHVQYAPGYRGTFACPMVVRALYTYEGRDSDELSFVEGDELTVLGQPDDTWYWAELNGKYGVVPISYMDTGN